MFELQTKEYQLDSGASFFFCSNDGQKHTICSTGARIILLNVASLVVGLRRVLVNTRRRSSDCRYYDCFMAILARFWCFCFVFSVKVNRICTKWAIICERIAFGCCVTAVYVSARRQSGTGSHHDRSKATLTQFRRFFFALTVRMTKCAQNEPLFTNVVRPIDELRRVC